MDKLFAARPDLTWPGRRTLVQGRYEEVWVQKSRSPCPWPVLRARRRPKVSPTFTERSSKQEPWRRGASSCPCGSWRSSAGKQKRPNHYHCKPDGPLCRWSGSIFRDRVMMRSARFPCGRYKYLRTCLPRYLRLFFGGWLRWVRRRCPQSKRGRRTVHRTRRPASAGKHFRTLKEYQIKTCRKWKYENMILMTLRLILWVSYLWYLWT